MGLYWSENLYLHRKHSVKEAYTAFVGGCFFDGQSLSHELFPVFEKARLVAIENAVTIRQRKNTEVIELQEEIITPGFVDLQVNGGGGLLFNTDRSVNALATIASAHKKSGTVGLLPTLISDTPEVTRSAVDAVVSATRSETTLVPEILGLHLEGPHLSHVRRGAHCANMIRPMLDEDLSLILDAASQLPVLMVTIAPENVTIEQASIMAKAGVVVSLGHTDTDFKTASSYFDVGVSCVTHLFNAMSQLTSREPGTVGAALATIEVNAGLIADGIHVHPTNLKLAWNAKSGSGRIFLVSDAMAVAGTTMTSFTLNGRETSRKNGRLELKDGTLAGADLDVMNAVRRMHEDLGIGLGEVLKAAISTPREIIRTYSESSSSAYRVKMGTPLSEFIRINPESWNLTTIDTSTDEVHV